MEILENTLLNKELNRINMNILEVSFARIDSEWNMRNVISPFIRLYYAQTGEAYLRYGEKTVKMTGGNIYLIPSNLEFSYWCDSSMCKLYAHINILGYNNYDLFSNYHECIVLAGKQREIDALITQWQRADILSTISIKTSLYRTVLEALLQEHISLGAIEEYSDLVRRAIQIIKNSPHLSLTAHRLAQLLFVSPSQLQKKFRQEMKISLGQYINEQVMFAAVNLLRSPEASIKEISDTLGFCDQFHFSRRFCKYYGMPPSHYRKSILF